ncbi:putative autophagy-related protein 2 CAD motif containing protein [Lyophyllum shimeji]|uniref:Autophagy-related protein 2 n=1 Tax=Lyophyllum shimeji TaxID=47721 RepID=A0A9P3PG98_LYOSH|nr:putative autophagy-related protein 2 CAD motif containing protein [Lyophyllum shimeji]
MPPWYSSWLPGLPSINFALPSSLQGRFISFVLKKSLGHFLRPGQLDSKQIDSQIGSGFVQVNDLELDNEAINAIISDLPIVLHDGYISSVVARIPWPNPLTSTLGFSLESLRLTFYLLPPSYHVNPMGINLADSVASVAESFVHDELTPQEGATLWNSFHPDVSPAVQQDDLTLPGALVEDPFLSNPDEMPLPDTDPAGVSIFASLIERLLARFEFDATNTQITLVHPGNMSITASIPEIRYRTDNDGPPVASDSIPGAGQRRILSIAGLSLTARNLRSETPTPEPSTPNARSPASLRQSSSPHSPRALSPSSSSSSLDEETQFSMSQSLAFLPPRSSSPASSVASSMYQSAVSTAPTLMDSGLKPEAQPLCGPPSPVYRSQDVPDFLPPPEQPQAEQADILLSLGSSPILVHVSTPSPVPAGDGSPPASQTEPSVHESANGYESIHLTVSIGVVACALRAWHVRALLSLCNDFTSYRPSNYSATSSDPSLPQSGLKMKASVKLRGLVLLVPYTSCCDGEDAHETSFTDFFRSPLVPPNLADGYLRLYLEGISASISSSHRRMEFAKPTVFKTLSCGLTVGDVSLFSFYRIPNSASPPGFTLVASPILITDHDLPSQYDPRHHHPSKDSLNPELPTFEILDWTAEKHQANSLKLSLWRTKPSRRRKPARKEGTIESRRLPPAISITLQKPQGSSLSHQPPLPSDEVQINVVPLHIFLDLGSALPIDKIVTSLDEAIGGGSDSGHGSSYVSGARNDYSDSNDGESETPPASPRARSVFEKEKERRRLEKLVFEDLNLDFDYGIKQGVYDTAATKQGVRKRKTIQQSVVRTSIAFDMIRVQIRCPPPARRPLRSGALVIDVHGIRLFNSPEPSKKGIRFAAAQLPDQREAPQPSNEILVFGAEIKRMNVACCPAHESVATSIFSLGSLVSRSDAQGHDDFEAAESPLAPRITVTQSNPASVERSAVLALSFEIPSVVVDISKHILDSLQYWVDDMAQRLDKAFNGEYGGDDSDDKAESRDTSLIGSRFFAKSRSGSGSALSTTPGGSQQSETVVKLNIAEAFVTAVVPRAQQRISCPFIIYASDLDVLIELKPEGEDETVLTLGIMDVTMKDTTTPHSDQTFISLTSPRSLMSIPRSMIKLRFTSLVVPGTTAKESRIKLTLAGFTFTVFPDFSWITDLAAFVQSPPGTFESVIPSERTRISLKVSDGAIRAFAPSHLGAIVLQVDDLDFSTDVVGESPDSSFRLSVPALALLAVDDVSNVDTRRNTSSHRGVALWKSAGFALLAEVADLSMSFFRTTTPPATTISIDRVRLQTHICADSLAAVTAFGEDLGTVFYPPAEERKPKTKKRPTMVSEQTQAASGLMASVDDLAFKRVPEVGPPPDMVSDDLPTNMDYLDESFGAAAGLRELRDDDLDEFDVDESLPEYAYPTTASETCVISRVGGETVKMLRPEGIQVIEDYFDNLPPDAASAADEFGETTFRLRIHDGDITLFLYDGYDWVRTRKTIEEEVKEMRRRLAKIRQLVASGQTQDPSAEETGALLFNSLYIGLDRDVDGLEPGAIIAAIDEELKDDPETASQSSWQSLKPPAPGKPRGRSVRVHGKRLTRSRGPSMEFHLSGLEAEVDHYLPDAPVVSRTLATVRDVEILDHIKTSTWKKFLTELRSDSQGNIRETDSNMIRVELRTVRPVPDHPMEEARLRAKILPLRLYVDQDAVDFLKAFFSFKDPQATPTAETEDDQIYFQSAEVFPVDLKLDYKPRRVDYRALREGRTIELMNFFHFDGAEMTLRHITLAGITGWPRLFELLNDLWTPDVKATQLAEVISGVSPIRSVVNVGSGVADLVLLPIAQYKKDGRIVRGVQKGTTAFVKSTAIEAIKLGARLATGTQVILEQAEGVLGGQFNHSITAEAVPSSTGDDFTHLATDEDEEPTDTISKYAQQPGDIKEGVQSAYRSLRKNLNSAAQTILAVPMEVYERSGNEGPVRAVIRAVPIAVLKPMIGASEAVSKTLLGLHNTLDPDVRHENEAKYKRR